MKAKHVFTTLGLALTMGLGVAAGLSHVREFKQAKADETTTLYCKMTYDWWKINEFSQPAAIGVYYWGGSSSVSWPGVRGTAVEDEVDVWKFEIPSNSTGFIFTRVNASGDIADWGAKTGDLSFEAGKNLYTITSSEPVWGDPGVTGSWGTYTPKVDPSTETNDFIILDEYKVLGNNVGALHVYGYGQESTIKDMDWPGTGTVETHATDILPTYQGHISTSYPNIIINNGNGEGAKQTVNIEDFESNYSSKILRILNTTDESGHYNYEWKASSDIVRPETEGYYISSAGLWDYAHAEKMTNTDQDGNVAYCLGLQLNVGAIIRVRSFYTDRAPFDQWANLGTADSTKWEKNGDNLEIKVSGKYDIYAKYVNKEFKFFISEAATTCTVSIYASLFKGREQLSETKVTELIAYSDKNLKYTPAARDGYVMQGIFEDQACSETPYSPKIITSDTNLYVRYMMVASYMLGDATFTGDADTAWNVNGGVFLSPDVLDTANNRLEGIITISGASPAEPVEVRPASYTAEGTLDYFEYSLGVSYEFAKKVGNNIQFNKNGAFAIYVNKSNQIYINEGADAFYTKFLTEVGDICDYDGNTNVTNLLSVWSGVEDVYNSLSTAEKNAIKAVTFVGGDPSGDNLHKMVAMYHYVVVKYFSQGINDFIWNAYSPSNVMNNSGINNIANNTALVVILVATISVISAAGLFLAIRRRKHN